MHDNKNADERRKEKLRKKELLPYLNVHKTVRTPVSPHGRRGAATDRPIRRGGTARDRWARDLHPRPSSAQSMHMDFAAHHHRASAVPPTPAAPAEDSARGSPLRRRKNVRQGQATAYSPRRIRTIPVGIGPPNESRAPAKDSRDTEREELIAREESRRMGLEESYITQKRLRDRARARRNEIEAGIARLIQLQPSALDALTVHHHLRPRKRTVVQMHEETEEEEEGPAMPVTSTFDIWMAAKDGSLFHVKQMLEDGVSVDAEDEFGETALLTATRAGRTNIVQFLLDAKADVNKGDLTGEAPIHCASFLGDVDVMSLLFNAQAEVNLVDKRGDTALHWAARNGKVKAVKMLMEKGADTGRVNLTNQTPLSISVASEFHERFAINDLLRASRPHIPRVTSPSLLRVVAEATRSLPSSRVSSPPSPLRPNL